MAEKLSAKHARLVEIYGTPDPGLSLEQGLRRQRLTGYDEVTCRPLSGFDQSGHATGIIGRTSLGFGSSSSGSRIQ